MKLMDIDEILCQENQIHLQAADLSPDETESHYRLTNNGYQRLIRTKAVLHFFIKGKIDDFLKSVFQAFLSEIDHAIAEISLHKRSDDGHLIRENF